MTVVFTDWTLWHDAYDDEQSSLSRRLRSVRRSIEDFLDRRAGEPVRVVSACAGDGRDLLEVLARRPDSARVRARLVELDPRLARRASTLAASLPGVEVLRDDAGLTTSYVGAVPADLVLMCGVFGNISDRDVHQTIAMLPQLCAERAEVIWTRGVASGVDVSPTIQGWFSEAGFTETAFDAPSDSAYRVGVHRIDVPPVALEPGRQLFRFVR